MTRHLTCLLAALLLSPLLHAEGIVLGEPLPDLVINEHGELILEGDDVSYQPWRLPAAWEKITVLQYMAGRTTARDQSKPFTDQLEPNLPEDSFSVTTIINLDDALWGTSGFVMSQVKSNKRKYPKSTFVLDESGTGAETLGLTPKGAAVVILDTGGTVLHFKEGAWSEEEIQSTLEMMRQHIANGE